MGNSIQGDKPVWLVASSILSRILWAIKLSVFGVVLTPLEFGKYCIALIFLGLMDGLTSLGINESIIQYLGKISKRQETELFTMTLVRSLGIGLIMYLFSNQIAFLFGTPSENNVIKLTSLIPLFRAIGGPGIAIAQNSSKYQKVSIIQATIIGFDVLASLLAVNLVPIAEAAILGSIFAEIVGSITTQWKCSLITRLAWPSIQTKNFRSFGFWIWLSNVLIVLINQIDKILIGKFSGATALAPYHATSRVLQLAIADPALIISNSAYPELAKAKRDSPHRAKDLALFLHKSLMLVSIFISILIEAIWPRVKTILPGLWPSVDVYFLPLMASMCFGVGISMLVVWLRSLGKPHLVTIATGFQAFTLVMGLIYIYESNRMFPYWISCISAISLLISWGIMYIMSKLPIAEMIIYILGLLAIVTLSVNTLCIPVLYLFILSSICLIIIIFEIIKIMIYFLTGKL